MYDKYFGNTAASSLAAQATLNIESLSLGLQLIESLSQRTPLPVEFWPVLDERKHAGWTLAMDTQLVAYLNQSAGKGVEVSAWTVDMVKFSDSQRESLSLISSLPTMQILERAVLLSAANQAITASLGALDLGGELVGPLAGFSSIKGLLLTKYKVAEMSKHLNATPKCTQTPDVNIHRLADSFLSSGRKSYRRTVFGQLYRQLKTRPATFWRRGAGRTWKVNFVGEYSYDAGGPYRESIALLGEELSSPDKTTLVVWIPNHKSNTGLNKDCVLPNPRATHPKQHALLEFLGRLLGSTFYSKESLPLHFPPVFWKKLAGDQLSLEDLRDFDSISYTQISGWAFDPPLGASFETDIFDGTVVELLPGGGGLLVDDSNASRFVQLATHAKLHAFEAQMDSIRRGLAEVIPLSLLRLFTWQELQLQVCGETDFSVDDLKSATTVESSLAGSPTEAAFWEVLRSFTAEERTKFLRFAWGQGSLPPPTSPTFKKMTLALQSDVSDPDRSFPKSATCFFKVYIPMWTSQTACRRQLLYAINNALSIDTDGSLQVAEAIASSDDDEI